MKKYLKMSDLFEGGVTANHGDEYNGWSVVETSCGLSIDESGDGGFEAMTADYVAHAINNHDELVAMNKELLAALEEAKSVLSSINASWQHKVEVEDDDEPAFWQRNEWVTWAKGEILPMIEAAIAKAKGTAS